MKVRILDLNMMSTHGDPTGVGRCGPAFPLHVKTVEYRVTGPKEYAVKSIVIECASGWTAGGQRIVHGEDWARPRSAREPGLIHANIYARGLDYRSSRSIQIAARRRTCPSPIPSAASVRRRSAVGEVPGIAAAEDEQIASLRCCARARSRAIRHARSVQPGNRFGRAIIGIATVGSDVIGCSESVRADHDSEDEHEQRSGE